jgi:hypothetical protein
VLAIVRAKGPGKITVRAQSGALAGDAVTVQAR